MADSATAAGWERAGRKVATRSRSFRASPTTTSATRRCLLLSPLASWTNSQREKSPIVIAPPGSPIDYLTPCRPAPYSVRFQTTGAAAHRIAAEGRETHACAPWLETHGGVVGWRDQHPCITFWRKRSRRRERRPCLPGPR